MENQNQEVYQENKKDVEVEKVEKKKRKRKTEDERLTELREKIAQLKAQEEKIENEKKERERKARTRRFIQVGATIEKYIKESFEVEDDWELNADIAKKIVEIATVSEKNVCKALESERSDWPVEAWTEFFDQIPKEYIENINKQYENVPDTAQNNAEEPDTANDKTNGNYEDMVGVNQ